MVEGSVNGFLPTHTATATAQAGNVTDALPDAASSDHGSGGVTSHELFPTHSATPTVNAGNTTGSSLNTTASHDGLIGGIVSSSLPSETDRGSFRNQTTSFFYPTATSGASLNKSMPISDGILPPPKSTGNLLPNATSPYLNVNATLPTTGSAASGPLLNLTTPSLSPHINVTHGLPKPTYSTSMPILSSPMPSANATIPSVSSSGGYPTLYPSGARNSSAGPKESGAFSNGTTIVPSPTSSARLSSIAADTVSTVSTVSTASTALKTSKTSPLASSSTSKVTIFTPASTSMSQTVTTKQTPSAHIDSTMTEMSVATSILTAPWSTSFAKTATPSATITSQAHAVVPDQITPPTPVPSAKGAVLIQIGFKPRFLPYYWIARNSDSINQIAKYVPLNLAEALNIPVTDTPFVAIDEWKEYHMALVRCYIPGDKLHNLSGQLHSFASPLFNSKEPPARALFQYVDPNVPLIPGEGGTPPVETTDSSFVMGPSKSGGGRSGSDGYGNSNNNGGGDSIDSNTNGPAGSGSSSQIHPRSVGIGLGVVAGAAVYGAAMFWIARRRRQGKNGDAAAAAAQNGAGRPGLDGSGGGHAGSSSAVTPGHNRVSSVTGRPYTEESSQMSMLSNGGVYAYYGPPPTLEETSRPSRASNRTTPAQISAPVRSANSLGWT
ncbi:hypothetical protein KEM54_002666 [Ascosphaera aggregata]|nr:hypothetical protein KEM54_002666 [Ascosphaera aggregata]